MAKSIGKFFLKVASFFISHPEILDFVKDLASKEGGDSNTPSKK